MTFTLPENTIRKMVALGDKYDEVTKAVLKEGVTPLYDIAKVNLSASIKNGTGDLLKSLCTTKPFQDKNNDWNIKIGCAGVDRKGVSNAMKAAVYIVLIPLYDGFDVYADNKPSIEIQEVQLAIYCKGNYLELTKSITRLLIDAGFIITNRKYIEYEEDTKLHHYIVDVAMEFCY